MQIASSETKTNTEILNPKHHLAIIGASGRVGRRLQHFLSPYYHLTASQHIKEVFEPDDLFDVVPAFDVANPYNVMISVEHMAKNGARTVINCSGVLSVDASESTRGDKDSPMYRVHVLGAENLALACKKLGLKIIQIGTEYEFRGDKEFGQVYNEDEQPDTTEDNPTWYGQTKAIGGQRVLEIYPEGSTLVRLSQVQGPAGGLFLATLKALTQSDPKSFTRANNQYVSAITDYTVTDAIELIEKALHEGDTAPVYHVSPLNSYTSFEICLKLAKEFGLEERAKILIQPVTLEYLVQETKEQAVVRPKNSILGISRFENDFGKVILGTVEDEIALFKSAYGNLF